MWIERDELRTLAVVLVLFVLFGVGVWLPARQHRADLRQHIEEARDTLGIDLADTHGLASLHQQVIALRQTVRGAQRYVPRQDELDSLLRSLTEAMNAYGVAEQEIVSQRVEHFAHYSVVPMRIDFHGTFPSTFGVLKQIEAMPRLIRIEELELEQAQQSPGEELSVTLQLSAFVAGDQEEASR